MFDYLIHNLNKQGIKRVMIGQNPLKQGNVQTYQILQNTITYQLRLASTAKGLWACIQQSSVAWKLTITNEMVEQTVSKASNSKETMSLKDFSGYLLLAVGNTSERWNVGIMTPIQLQVLRGGKPSKQANNNKIYLILSDKQKKLHYPFTFLMNELGERDKLIQAIKNMKNQLQELRAERTDRSQSSFSILNDNFGVAEQLKLQNQQMKRKIRIYQESLTQKRGAVQIDIILKEKNNLQMQAQTKKREQLKQITRLKNIYQMVDRQMSQTRNEVDLINRQIALLEDSVGNSAKLKSHAMKVLKSYENQLRTQKKVVQKQVKELQNLKRNILSSKNNQKKIQAKIKQIQTEIDQATKKTNLKQVSNRLHSKGKVSNADSASDKSQSIGSSTGKPRSQTNSNTNKPSNLVRDNLVRNAVPGSPNRNNLLKTSPNINMNQQRNSNEKNAPRAINSSHQPPKNNTNTNPRLFNTQKYRSGSKSENENDSVKSRSAQKKQTPFTKPGVIPRNVIPKAPSVDKDRLFKKSEQNPRVNSNQKVGYSANKGVSGNKDNAKEMLQKMKEIKAQYNLRAATNSNKNIKPVEATDRKYK